MNEEAVKALVDGSLVGEGWAQKAAEALVAMVAEYEETGMVSAADLAAAEGPQDPLETFCRAHAEASVAVQLPLLLPAAWVHAGAVGQGGWWGSWNGRAQHLVVPLIDHHIGLAGTGAGKTTMHGRLNPPFRAGLKAGAEKLSVYLDELALLQRSAIAEAMKAWQDECNNNVGDKKNAEAFNQAKGVLMRAVDTVAMLAAKKTNEAGGGSALADATVESVVSLAAEVGGAVFVRAAEQDFLDNLTRYSATGQSGSLSLLTMGWDGDPYSRLRKGSGAEDVASLVLSLSLMTQDESFAKMFNGPAGIALLDKGVLGRAWMTRGEDVNPVLAAQAELQHLEDARAGLDPAGLDFEQLATAFARMAQASAQARAIRAVQGRVSHVAFSDKAALGLSDKAVTELKKALAMAELAVGQAVTRESVELNYGVAGGATGVVLQVGREDAIRLESLFALCKLLSGSDPVLAPALSRYVSHVVRIAGIRAAVAAGAGSAEEFTKFVGAAEIPGEWIADTAARVAVWWLRQHLSITAEIRDEQVQTQTRDTAMKESRYADASLEGLAAQKMVHNAMLLPKSVSEVVDQLSRWGGLVPASNRTQRYDAFKQMFTRIAKEGSEYFVVTKKPNPQGGKAGMLVEPGPKYLDMMKQKAATG